MRICFHICSVIATKSRVPYLFVDNLNEMFNDKLFAVQKA